jgi:hypothetical protein
MTMAELISGTLALLALIISSITAYRTLFSRFSGEVFLKAHAVFIKTQSGPSIVIGCEFENSGAKSGSVEDLIIKLIYHQRKNSGINSYAFLPFLMRQDYNVLRSYSLETDLEPFHAIPIAAKSHSTQYILFRPSDDNFFPVAGDFEILLYSRNSGSKSWKLSKKLCYDVENEQIEIWTSQNGKGILLEARQYLAEREKLLVKVFA